MKISESIVRRLLVLFAGIIVLTSCALNEHHTIRSKNYNEGTRYRAYISELPESFSENDTVYLTEYVVCRAESEGMFGSYHSVQVDADSIMSFSLASSDSLTAVQNHQEMCHLAGRSRYLKRANFPEQMKLSDDDKYYILPVLNLRGGSGDIQPYTSYAGMRETSYSYGYNLNLFLVKNRKEVFRSRAFFFKNSRDSMEMVQLNQDEWNLLVELALKDFIEVLSD